MVLNEHIAKKEIMRTYHVATKTQRQWCTCQEKVGQNYNRHVKL